MRTTLWVGTDFRWSRPSWCGRRW